TLFWDFMGGVWEYFKNRESFDLYICRRCGKVEFFIEGVGGDVREKPVGPDDDEDFEAFPLLLEASRMEREGAFQEARGSYEQVLGLPSYKQWHDYARRRIQAI